MNGFAGAHRAGAYCAREVYLLSLAPLALRAPKNPPLSTTLQSIPSPLPLRPSIMPGMAA